MLDSAGAGNLIVDRASLDIGVSEIGHFMNWSFAGPGFKVFLIPIMVIKLRGDVNHGGRKEIVYSLMCGSGKLGWWRKALKPL